MRLEGPKTYAITVTAHDRYAVTNEEGGTMFMAPATRRGPKLYVFAEGDALLYVGQTVQAMSARMRLGFQADGTNGYHGYRWRHHKTRVDCHIWRLQEVPAEEELYHLECIESEVVFRYRSNFKQWPLFQTEIHFHQSTDDHRRIADDILSRFPGLAPT